MAIIRQVLCDQCGEVLEGRKGTAEIRQDHIWLQGKLCYEDWDEDTRRWVYFFATPPNGEQLAFCDFKCFKAFSEMKKEQRQNYLKTRLIAEANGAPLPPDPEAESERISDAS